MTVYTAWPRALPAVAVPVLVVGTLGWVFPRETNAALGSWVLPALSVIGLILALGWAVAEWRPLAGPLAVLACMVLVGWNPASVTSTSHFAGVCLGILTMLVIASGANVPDRLRLAVLGFLTAGMGALLLGLVGARAAVGRLESVLHVTLATQPLGLAGLAPGGDVNENVLGAAALLVAPLGIAVLVMRTGTKIDWLVLKPVGVAALSVAVVAMALSNSRAAWMALWLTLVGLLVHGMHSKIARIVVGAAIVAPLFVVLATVASLNQRSLVRTVDNVWSSAQSRVPIMSQGLARLRESPWLGIGLNEYRSVYYPRGNDIAHAHNIVLQTALDVGAIGSVAYWGLFAWVLVRARQISTAASQPVRAVAAGATVSLVASTLFGLVDAVPLGSKVGLLQWMAGGLILAAWRMRSPVAGRTDLETVGSSR